MDRFLSRISDVVDSLELTDTAKIEQIKAILLEAAVEPVAAGGVIEAIIISLEAMNFSVNSNLNLAGCSTGVEPSLEGARLEDGLVGSRSVVLVKLKELGRRPATVAEGLLYALTHPEEVRAGSWIWCLDQVLVVEGIGEVVLVLHVRDGDRSANLYLASCEVGGIDRVLSFPVAVEA